MFVCACSMTANAFRWLAYYLLLVASFRFLAPFPFFLMENQAEHHSFAMWHACVWYTVHDVQQTCSRKWHLWSIHMNFTTGHNQTMASLSLAHFLAIWIILYWLALFHACLCMCVVCEPHLSAKFRNCVVHEWDHVTHIMKSKGNRTSNNIIVIIINSNSNSIEISSEKLWPWDCWFPSLVVVCFIQFNFSFCPQIEWQGL